MVGERIRALRKQRGLSQYQLAKAAQVSQGLIWQLEANRKGPGLRTLVRIARALSVSLDQLLPVVSEPKQEVQQ